MTQAQWIVLSLKIVLVCAELSIITFVATYWHLAKWYKNALGRTIVVKDILLFGALLLPVLSLFFNFSRLTSNIAAWVSIAFFGAITPVMLWRTAVWVRVHRDKGLAEPDPVLLAIGKLSEDVAAVKETMAAFLLSQGAERIVPGAGSPGETPAADLCPGAG